MLSSVFDISIYKDITPIQSKCTDFKSCFPVRRLLSSLWYYSSFRSKTNKDDQNALENFINETYQQHLLITYFHHFQKQHDNQLYQILQYATNNSIFQVCPELRSCEFAARHYRIPDSDDKHQNMKLSDPYLNLYYNTMDSFHYYLFHLFQGGLRIARQPDNNIYDTDDHKSNNKSYDPAFSRMVNIIGSTRTNSIRFDRISSGNKYKIEMQSDVTGTNMDEAQGTTYLDGLFKQLYEKDFKQQTISKLYAYLKNEGFDTESMDIDIQMKVGNISSYVRNEQCINAINCIFNDSRGMLEIL